MIIPNKGIQTIWPNLLQGSDVLDLGFGVGRDSLFLAEKGFNVIAVDKASQECEKLTQIILQKGEKNIQVVCKNIKDFEIEREKYSLINAINVIQFLDKNSGIEIMGKIKEGVTKGGYVVITSFTKLDPMFLKYPQNCIFDKDELKNLFSDFEIISYEEKMVDDQGHPDRPGYEEPHQHGIVRIVAKKFE